MARRPTARDLERVVAARPTRIRRPPVPSGMRSACLPAEVCVHRGSLLAQQPQLVQRKQPACEVDSAVRTFLSSVSSISME
jgi:hypothetical protein